MIDEQVKYLIEKNPSMTVPHYLMSSYLYYEENTHYISDGCYDWLCKFMLEHWNEIKHYHKHIIEYDVLKAGTGFYIKEYPSIVKGAAKRLLKEKNLY